MGQLIGSIDGDQRRGDNALFVCWNRGTRLSLRKWTWPVALASFPGSAWERKASEALPGLRKSHARL